MLFGVAVVLVLLNIHPIHSSYVSVDHNFATDPTPTASIPIQDEWSLFQSFLENLPSNETKHQLLQSSANTHGVGQCLSDLRQIQGQVKNLSFNALRSKFASLRIISTNFNMKPIVRDSDRCMGKTTIWNLERKFVRVWQF